MDARRQRVAKTIKTYVDSPSTNFTRKVLILSTIKACISIISFVIALLGVLFVTRSDQLGRNLVALFVSAVESTAAVSFIVFFRGGQVRSQAKMFAFPVALYALVNLLYLFMPHNRFTSEDIVQVIAIVLLALIAADCYFGFRRIGISSIFLMLIAAHELIGFIKELFRLLAVPTIPSSSVASGVAFLVFATILSLVPYLIMILYLLERKAIAKRLAESDS
jgi:hypothetical protein